ncbi:MAG TPA: AAA family ATPase [Vicinamibacteria bacterium]|nr:AAA family ATPase [Vicinamibacteria bacterium]
MSPLDSGDFTGTRRFALHRRLGEGGFGVVYEAHDRERGARVALKTLRGAHGDSIYRLKQEFRTLADLAHPNLVQLYELLWEADRWFFTMELVDGVDWVAYVRGSAGTSTDFDAETQDTRTRTHETAAMDEAAALDPGREAANLPPLAPPPSAPLSEAQESVLRDILRQVVEGLQALHAAGKMHRDIKPSNVLVTRAGRVVILDFGLATDRAPAVPAAGTVAGTPHYIAPELVAGEATAEAADWYSVGVMLFEALTGRRPYAGRSRDVLTKKLGGEPPAEGAFALGTAPDLEHLCRSLLRRNPAHRPRGEDILCHLGATGAASPSSSRVPVARASSPALFGREGQLRALQDALRAVRQGRAVAALVRGGSGMGKTALVRHFLADLQDEGGVLVLRGRCYEQESVPYKAVDSLMDALSQHLRQLAPEVVREALPGEVAALARLFPVLNRVGPIAASSGAAADMPEPSEVRRRAFDALRHLVGRLARRQPVVLFIDDLQWGDIDSAALLAELMRPPDAPPVLLIGSYRVEEASTSPLLRVLLPSLSSVDKRPVDVDHLTPGEARELAHALLRSGGVVPSDADAIARDSGGSPFFISELAQEAAARPGPAVGQPRETTVEGMIRARIDRLPAASRRLLEVVAVAGQPAEKDVLAAAAGVDGGVHAALVPLQAARLVRTRETVRRDEVEAYHDRIRETVVAGLPPAALAACHRSLAHALEASPHPDPETLAVHFRAAGEQRRAGRYAVQAGDKAAQALAFDRAARLYRLALDLGPGGPEERALRVKLGDALGHAGRGAESAQAYLAAVRGGTPVESLELQRRAADQLLRCGHLDEGLAVLRDVLGRLGLKLPRSTRSALAGLVLRRLWLRLRGLAFRERDQSLVPPEALLRIDACWSVATTLSLVDPIRAQGFQARHLLLALRSGEPRRVARAIACESPFLAMAGRRSRAATDRLLERAERFAEELDDTYLRGLVALTMGSTAHLQGRYLEARRRLERADGILREKCRGVVWELDTNNTFWLTCLLFLGEWKELILRVPRLLKEAEDRGDVFAQSQLGVRFAYVIHLARDRPDDARRQIREAMGRWPSSGFNLLDFWSEYAEAETDLYDGQARRALERLTGAWGSILRARIFRIQVLHIRSLYLRACCALAAAGEAGGPSVLPVAEADAGRLERMDAPSARALAEVLRGALALHRGAREEGTALLARAEGALEGEGLSLHAAAVRRRRGEVIGGVEGARLVEAADAVMTGQGILNPARMTAKFVPAR